MTFLYSLASTTLIITPIIILLLMFSPLLDKKYAVVGRCWLWLMVIAGLFAPFISFATRPLFQIYVPLTEFVQEIVWEVVWDNPNQNAAVTASAETSALTDITASSDNAFTASISYSQISNLNNAQFQTKTNEEISAPPTAALISTALPENKSFSFQTLTFIEALWFIWLYGAIIYALYHFLVYMKFIRFVKRWSEPVTNDSINTIFHSEYTSMAIRKNIRFLQCKGIKSPLLTGFFCPMLLIPYNCYNIEDIPFMIQHEFTHYKRHDLLYKLLLVAVQCIYWFNPVIHWMAAQANKDIETACDVKTVSGMDMEQRIRYSEIILSMASNSHLQQNQYLFRLQNKLTTSFTGSKAMLKQRFSNILGRTKKSGTAFFSLLGCIILVSSLSVDCCFSFPTVTAATILAEEIEGEITVSCYRTDLYPNFLQNAAAAFEKEYPCTTINVETTSAPPTVTREYSEASTLITTLKDEENLQSELDYINKMNAALMAGEGPDIIAADIIPYYKYAESGYLIDMLSYMKEDSDFKRSDYKENILDAVLYNGGQYILPINYSFNYISYDSSLFTAEEKNSLAAQNQFTYEQLIEIGQASFERNRNFYMFGFTGGVYQPTHMFRYLFAEHYKSFVDIPNKKVYFDDGRFAQLLSSVTEYCDNGYIRNAATDEGWIQGSPKSYIPNTSERFLFKTKDERTLLKEFVKSETDSFYTPLTGNDEDDAILGLLADANGDISLKFNQAYAINAHSKNKRVAWEFIKFLLSKDMQQSSDLFFLPIYKNTLEQKAISAVLAEKNNPYGASNTNSALPLPYNNYIACLQTFSDKVNTYLIRDSYINSMIDNAVTEYFNGKISAYEAAQTLQREIELYLSIVL